MTTYYIEYDTSVRYRCAVTADSPESAIEQFWLDENNYGDHNAAGIDSSGPNGLSMTDSFGRAVVWGERTDLS